jgi:hypothetical protein
VCHVESTQEHPSDLETLPLYPNSGVFVWSLRFGVGGVCVHRSVVVEHHRAKLRSVSIHRKEIYDLHSTKQTYCQVSRSCRSRSISRLEVFAHSHRDGGRGNFYRRKDMSKASINFSRSRDHSGMKDSAQYCRRSVASGRPKSGREAGELGFSPLVQQEVMGTIKET